MDRTDVKWLVDKHLSVLENGVTLKLGDMPVSDFQDELDKELSNTFYEWFIRTVDSDRNIVRVKVCCVVD